MHRKSHQNHVAVPRAPLSLRYGIGIIDNMEHFGTTGPFRMEHITLNLCTQGCASVRINEQIFRFHKNDLLVCPNHNTLGVEKKSSRFRSTGIALSLPFLQQVLPVTEMPWDLHSFFSKNPVFPLDAHAITAFTQYAGIFKRKLSENIPNGQIVITAIAKAFMYDMQTLVKTIPSVDAPTFSTYGVHFRNFIQLIEKTNPKKQNVAFYAQKLCMSPKHLNEVCKQASNYYPSELIEQAVYKDIEYMFRYTNLSIKEIAIELGFPNPSFFAKYVKRLFGVYPKGLREYFRTHPAKS